MGNVSINCAKALAIRAGLKFAVEGNISKLVVESNSKRVIDALNRTDRDSSSSYLHGIVFDCHEVTARLQKVMYCFVSRSCNRVAHTLAALPQSLDFHVPKYWLGVAPSIVSLLIRLDCD